MTDNVRSALLIAMAAVAAAGLCALWIAMGRITDIFGGAAIQALPFDMGCGAIGVVLFFEDIVLGPAVMAFLVVFPLGSLLTHRPWLAGAVVGMTAWLIPLMVLEIGVTTRNGSLAMLYTGAIFLCAAFGLLLTKRWWWSGAIAGVVALSAAALLWMLLSQTPNPAVQGIQLGTVLLSLVAAAALAGEAGSRTARRNHGPRLRGVMEKLIFDKHPFRAAGMVVAAWTVIASLTLMAYAAADDHDKEPLCQKY